MTDWQDALSEITHYPADLGFGAYHEVGHTVVAKLVGKPITNILLYTDPMGNWGGAANYDEDSGFDLEWVTLDLDRYIPSRTLRLPYPGQPYPWDQHKGVRDFCTIQYAGKAAESLLYEQLGIPESPTLLDEDTDDIRRAWGSVRLGFKPEEQEKELLNAKARARFLLSEPICWRMVENLAQKLINSILIGKEPDHQYERNKVHIKEYEFGSNQIYRNFNRTLTGNRD